MAWNLRNLFLFLLLSGAALLTFVLARGPARPASTDLTTGDVDSGYHLVDAVAYRTDASGRILYRVFADRVQKRAENEDLSFDGVRVEYTPASQIRWEFGSSSAVGPADLASLDLRDVRATHVSDASGKEAVIETDALHLDADEHVASTDHPITLRRGESTLRATGMKAHLKNDIVELSNAVGSLDP
jgi:LPS export ABC transporter protein LptC